MKKKVLIIISQGIVCRNFLQTNFIPSVFANEDFEITIITSKILEKNFKDFNCVEIIKLPFLLLLISKALRQRFYSINPNKSLKIFSKEPLFKSYRSHLKFLLRFPFPQNNFIYQKLLMIFQKLCRKFLRKNESFMQLVKEQNLVLSTNPIDIIESMYVLEAKRCHIPTVSFVKSFDNLTTKGFLPFQPDHMFVWNYKMFFEAVSLYNLPASQVHVVGAPHFNLIRKSDTYTKKNLPLRLLYASVAEELNPSDVEIVRRLRESLDKDDKLLVRLHQNDRMARWESMSNQEGIEVFNPSMSLNSQERVATNNTLDSLQKQIEQCSVVINTASTMTLEALSLDRPVINVAFSLSSNTDISRYYSLEHYKYLEKSKNVYICYSFIELLKAVQLIREVGWVMDDDFNSLALGPRDTPAICKEVIEKIIASSFQESREKE